MKTTTTNFNFNKLEKDISNALHSLEALKHKHYSPKEHYATARLNLAIANYINDMGHSLDCDDAKEEISGLIDDLFDGRVSK